MDALWRELNSIDVHKLIIQRCGMPNPSFFQNLIILQLLRVCAFTTQKPDLPLCLNHSFTYSLLLDTIFRDPPLFAVAIYSLNIFNTLIANG